MALTNAERQARYKQRLVDAARSSQRDDIRWIEEIFEATVPGARCELWDYKFKVRCGALHRDGETRGVNFVRSGATVELVESAARQLQLLLAKD